MRAFAHADDHDFSGTGQQALDGFPGIRTEPRPERVQGLRLDFQYTL
jgi:hypothetical protein